MNGSTGARFRAPERQKGLQKVRAARRARLYQCQIMIVSSGLLEAARNLEADNIFSWREVSAEYPLEYQRLVSFVIGE
jgi:hypothetical protein